jgi:hypothetical protein
VGLIQHGGNPAYGRTALARQEELHLRVLKERIAARIEKGPTLKEQRRDP